MSIFPDKLNKDASVKKAFDLMSIMVLSPEEQELYEERIESLRLAKSILEQKYDDGKIEGKVEGKIEGKIEGKMEEKIIMIQEMLKENLDIATICKIVKLSETEIKKFNKRAR